MWTGNVGISVVGYVAFTCTCINIQTISEGEKESTTRYGRDRHAEKKRCLEREALEMSVLAFIDLSANPSKANRENHSQQRFSRSLAKIKNTGRSQSK